MKFQHITCNLIINLTMCQAAAELGGVNRLSISMNIRTS